MRANPNAPATPQRVRTTSEQVDKFETVEHYPNFVSGLAIEAAMAVTAAGPGSEVTVVRDIKSPYGQALRVSLSVINYKVEE